MNTEPPAPHNAAGQVARRDDLHLGPVVLRRDAPISWARRGPVTVITPPHLRGSSAPSAELGFDHISLNGHVHPVLCEPAIVVSSPSAEEVEVEDGTPRVIQAQFSAKHPRLSEGQQARSVGVLMEID